MLVEKNKELKIFDRLINRLKDSGVDPIKEDYIFINSYLQFKNIKNYKGIDIIQFEGPKQIIFTKRENYLNTSMML